MEAFSGYAHAIASLAIFAIITLLLSPMAGAARNRAGVAAGAMPPADYSNRDFRICRAYQNATENIGIFAVVVLAAVLAGASPFWVNLFASLFVVFRIVMLYVHIAGIGAGKEPGPRTILFVLGWLMLLLIAIMALIGAFA